MPKRGSIALSSEFHIVETTGFAAKVRSLEIRPVYQKARKYVYPHLRANPYFGPNSKKLKGEFSGVYRYRIGNHRLFYTMRKERTHTGKEA
jgi:mRNA interferase RelE/StbE